MPQVEAVVAKFQQVSQRLKYAQVPTIAAVDGLALGGGCEFSIHCSRIVATLESYIGLVEVGVGLLPAGGGCKEMAQRAAQEAQRFAIEDASTSSPSSSRYFQNIAMGEVAKSAELAREMGYLRQSDRIVLNRFELLHIAKEEARALNATAYVRPCSRARSRSPDAPASPPSRPRWSTCSKAASSPNTTTTSAAASPKPCAAAMWTRAVWWTSNGCSTWNVTTSWS